MNRIVKFILVGIATLSASSVFGMKGLAHKETAKMAYEFLQNGTEKQRWIAGFYEYHADRNGTSYAETIAKAAPQPDDFLDTVIGGWWVGYRYYASVQFLTNINFTSYWHFTSSFRPGKYGDIHSGFWYRVAPDDGFFGLNGIIKTVLYNQEIKSGSYENAKGLVLGLKDIFQVFTQDWVGLAKDFYMGEKSDFGIPGAPDVLHNYQAQSSAHRGNTTEAAWAKRVPASNWDDYQDVVFNPGANAGQWWYNEFTTYAEFTNMTDNLLRTLGYTMHWASDSATPQHVWSTTAHYHVDFESHIDEVISSQGYRANADNVIALIEEFKNDTQEDLTYRKKADGTPETIADAGGDPTLYAAGDILRWISRKAVQNDKVLTDDSASSFDPGARESIDLATTAIVLVLEKATADLYKKQELSKKYVDPTNPVPVKLFGDGKVTVGGVEQADLQIR